MRRLSCAALLLAAALPLQARVFTVGPGREYAQLRDVFTGNDLAPGDVVSVDGGATYQSVVVGSNDAGSAAAPVVIRWSGTGAARPKLQGGTHTIKFERANHVVFEGFEVTGGTSTCIFNEAHDVTVRDVVVHGCPSHGILGADQNSGSFTLEYSEVYDTGAGTTKHALYMQSDEVAYPGSVFTMRFNRIHSGNGGNLLKSRHERTRVYYNWFEGAAYQELELIGPDCQTQQAAWTPTLAREDAEIVGNVFVHTSTWPNVARIGGDLNGRSMGRVRFLSNTFLIDRPGTARAVLVQLGLESLEMHGNVIHQTGSGVATAVAENPASSVETPYCAPLEREPWVAGRRIAGSYNWVETGASAPAEWGATRRGTDPGFADIAARRLRPSSGSPLIDMGTHAPQTPAGFEIAGSVQRAMFDPPPRRKLAPGEARERLLFAANVDIGALEEIDAADYLIPVNGSPPLLPPTDAPPHSPSPAQLAPRAARKPWIRLLRPMARSR